MILMELDLPQIDSQKTMGPPSLPADLVYALLQLSQRILLGSEPGLGPA